ncbi:NAD-dependent epimerase/dehydratase family protein [Mammaliicoccus sciuri]
MKVLITGGGGFIGSNTAEYFYDNGHDVYILDNLSTGKWKIFLLFQIIIS